MTPIALSRRGAGPRYPLLSIDPATDLKSQVAALASRGVTCDVVLTIMDDLKADPTTIARWFAPSAPDPEHPHEAGHRVART